MSRTINGNLTGAAAHRSWDDVPAEPLDPEIMIAFYRDMIELEKAQAERGDEWRNTHLRLADTWQAKLDAALAADGIPQNDEPSADEIFAGLEKMEGTQPSPIIYGGDKPENYDFTPFPKDMPDINFQTTDEIPF